MTISKQRLQQKLTIFTNIINNRLNEFLKLVVPSFEPNLARYFNLFNQRRNHFFYILLSGLHGRPTLRKEADLALVIFDLDPHTF